jgi:cytochrome oxidase Cu insertion factor (SCO1/SenC/PrrC family)
MPAAAARARRGRTAQIAAAAIAAAALIVAGTVVAVHALRSSSPPLQSTLLSRHGLDGQATWAAGAHPAPPITTLRDQSGRRFSLASLRGRTVVAEFFDSHCRQECPLAGRALAAAERSLPRGQRPVLLVVSVNPLDTPASARAAVRAWGLSQVAPWHWLMGSHAQLAPVWGAYHIFVRPTRGDITHTEALYLIDRRGDERSGYLYPYLVGRVTHDLRVLAASPPRRNRA